MGNNTKKKSTVKYSGFNERMSRDGEANLNGGEHESSDLIEESDGIEEFFVEDYGQIDTAEGAVCPYIS